MINEFVLYEAIRVVWVLSLVGLPMSGFLILICGYDYMEADRYASISRGLKTASCYRNSSRKLASFWLKVLATCGVLLWLLPYYPLPA